MKKKNNKLIFPALSHQMGWNEGLEKSFWTTYTTRMTLKEIAETIITAPEAKLLDQENNRTLRLVIQRNIKWSRVKDIANYIVRRDDRLFPPLIVAVFGTDFEFTAADLEDKENSVSKKGSKVGWFEVDDNNFNKNANFVAIDGQHRLAAIRAVTGIKTDSLLDDNYLPINQSILDSWKTEENVQRLYDGLHDEEMTVSFIPRPNEEDLAEKTAKYRRIFISINRHTKPTSDAENIIMDEVDPYAITLQRLTEDHEFFYRLNTDNPNFSNIAMSQNLREGATEFTTVKSLYSCLKTLLTTTERKNGLMKNEKNFISNVLEENIQQQLVYEATAIWDALLKNIEFCDEDGKLREYENLRSHKYLNDANYGTGNKGGDYLWLWPIGLETICQFAFDMMNNYGDKELISNIYVEGDEDQTASNLEKATKHLTDIFSVFSPDSGIDWQMNQTPWKGFFVQYNPDSVISKAAPWAMASGDRKDVMSVAAEVGSLLFSYGKFFDYGLKDQAEGYETATTFQKWKNKLSFEPGVFEQNEQDKLEGLVDKMREFMSERDFWSLKQDNMDKR